MSITLTPASLAAPETLGRAPLPTGLTAVTKAPQASRRWLVVAAAMTSLAAVCALLTVFIEDSGFQAGAGNSPADGMTIFAVFFVGALAIERLLEPLSSWLVPTDAEKEKSSETEGKARVKIAAVQGQADPRREFVRSAQDALETATQDKADLAEKKWERAIVMWAIASIVGMAVAASFKLYFLGTVGIAEATRWQEVLATGLIIGAGTKPLHDLTELISAKKQAAEAKA